MGVRGRGRGGGNCPTKFEQNSGENSGKARRKKIVCTILGKSTPLPPLTKESSYAHERQTERQRERERERHREGEGGGRERERGGSGGG